VSAAATASIGFALAAVLWWMYFARFDESVFDWALAGGAGARRRPSSSGTATWSCARRSRPWASASGRRSSTPSTTAPPRTPRWSSGSPWRPIVALSAIQRAAPRGLATSALVGRAAVAAIALVVAGLGHDLSALALVAVVTAATLAQTVAEAVAARRDAACHARLLDHARDDDRGTQAARR
jgi:hypothetical protein